MTPAQARRRVTRRWATVATVVLVVAAVLSAIAVSTMPVLFRGTGCGGCAPPLQVPIKFAVVVDGAVRSGPIPEFAGDKVSLLVRVHIPKGATLTCLVITPDDGAGCSYPGYGSRQGALLRMAGPLRAGVHTYRLSWTAEPALTSQASDRFGNDLVADWHATRPPGSYFGEGYVQQPIAFFEVVPDPAIGNRPLGLGAATPLASECGLAPSSPAPTVLLLDCSNGHAFITDLNWHTWTSTRAEAMGILETTDTCVAVPISGQRPCNSGTFNRHAAVVILTEPVKAGGITEFSRATVTYHVEWALHGSVRSFQLI